MADDEKEGLLFSAVASGNLAQVEELVSRYGISQTTDFCGGYLLLSNAINGEHTEVAKFLLQKGVWNVNSGNEHADTLLHFAAWKGDSELVQFLLDEGAPVNARNRQDETPLHKAIQAKSEIAVRLLLGRDANPNTVTEPSKHTPLHLAAETGNAVIVELLLSHGAKVNAQTAKGSTPLLLAAKYHRGTDIAKMLLDQGACVNITDENGNSPLHFAVRMKNSPLVSHILEHNPDIDDEVRKLVLSIIIHDKKTWPEIVDSFIDHGLFSERGVYSRLLRVATWKGYTKLVTYLLNGDTEHHDVELLHLAVTSGHSEIVRLLLNLGWDVNATDKMLKTPIFYSVKLKEKSKRAEITKLLLDTGTDGKVISHLLHFVIDDYDFKAFKILIESGVDVNLLDITGKTALHRAAFERFTNLSYEDKRLREWIERKSIINFGFSRIVSNSSKRIVRDMLLGEKKFKKKAVRLLLNNGADPNLKTTNGYTALHFSAMRGRNDDVRMLLKHGAEVNSCAEDNSTPLHLACVHGYGDVVDILLKNGANIKALQVNGFSPLHMAALRGHADIVKTLLKFDADVNAKGASNVTVLHCGVIGKSCEVVELLVEAGSDINVEDDSGKTASNLVVTEAAEAFVSVGLSRHSIHSTLKYHAIRLKAAGFYVSTKNLGPFNDDEPFVSIYALNFERKCEEEISRMKGEVLLKNNTLYDVFCVKRRNPRHMRNESLMNILGAFDFSKYPIYKRLLVSTFKKSRDRIASWTSGRESLHILLKTSNVLNEEKSPIPPTEILENIVSFLSKNDVDNLIRCGRRLKREFS